MANRYYGFNRGQTEFEVTEGASTGSTDVEFRVDDTKNLTKDELERFLQMLKNVILKNLSTAQLG